MLDDAEEPTMVDPDGMFVNEKKGEKVKAWDKYFKKAAPKVAPEATPDGWKLIHDGRRLEDGLMACIAELRGDLLWGNLALPIDKCLEKLREIDEIWKATPNEADRTDAQIKQEAMCRRECRDSLELSTQQLEEMMESKGEFGNEYRVVTAAWYMMMMPSTHLRSHLVAPTDASKAAWEFQEREFERRRVEGEKYRTARENETLFDEERARSHPYELTQTRLRYELTITIPVPARTRANDVRVSMSETHLSVMVTGHPLNPVIDGALYRKVEKHDPSTGCAWHVEGEFESRRVVLDLDKKEGDLGRWPCLMLADAPEEPPATAPPVVSGANGDVDLYGDKTQVLQRPQASDKFFSWGPPPPPKEGGSSAVRAARAQMVAGKLGGGGLPPLPPTEAKA